MKEMSELRMCHGKLRIDLERPFEMFPGSRHRLWRLSLRFVECLQIVLVGRKSRRVPLYGDRLGGQRQLERVRDRRGDLVLNREDIGQFAIVSL